MIMHAFTRVRIILQFSTRRFLNRVWNWVAKPHKETRERKRTRDPGSSTCKVPSWGVKVETENKRFCLDMLPRIYRHIVDARENLKLRFHRLNLFKSRITCTRYSWKGGGGQSRIVAGVQFIHFYYDVSLLSRECYIGC